MRCLLLRLCVALCWLLVSLGSGEDCTKPNSLIFRSPGNVSITGFFHAHEGENCSSPVGKGLEEAAATIWTVSLLNQQSYLPGLQIGLSLYDGCSSPDDVQRSLVQALVLENCLQPESTILGILASSEIEEPLLTLAASVNKSVTGVGPLLELTHLVAMTTALLRETSINTVHRVVADSQEILHEFGQTTAKEGICVYDQVLINDVHALNNEILQPPNNTAAEDHVLSDGAPVILVISASDKMKEMLLSLSSELLNMSDVLWILAPTDSALDIPLDLLPPTAYLLSAVMPKPEELKNFIDSPEVTNVPLNHRAPTKSPFFLNVASKILEMLQPVKQIYTKHCSGENETCAEVHEHLETGKFVSNEKTPGSLTADSIVNVITSLNLPLDEEMLLFSVTENFKSDDIAVFKIYNPETSIVQPVLLLIENQRRKRAIVGRVGIDDILNRGALRASAPDNTTKETITEKPKRNPIRGNAVGKHPCYDSGGYLSKNCGVCYNFVRYLSKVAQEKREEVDEVAVGWRYETWVGINASIAAIGVLCALAVAIFIAVRWYLDDPLEGNPSLSFLLLFSVIVAYASTLPFSFESSGTSGDFTWPSIICDLRVFGPPVSYGFIFSILFSRSVMLAASDQDDGFMSHVNGYVQTIILFFVLAVQVIFSAEFWFFNSFLGGTTTSCQTMYDNHRFIILLSYDALLLLLLIAIIPFVCRSKRNYKEGLFFSVAVSLVFLLWCTWVPLFYFLPLHYRDALVTAGLTSSATAILISVFISRSYLMTTAIVRDRIVSTLPALTHPENNYRSTVALYDAVNLNTKIGVPNPNFYAMGPSEPPTPQIRPGQYYSTDNGVKVPTPKRTAPQPGTRTSSPETTYATYDSPLNTPKNVTRF